MLCVMKTFTGFGGFMILLLGLGMLGITIFAMTKVQVIYNQYSYLIAILVIDLIIIFASIIGIIGVKRQKGTLILIFQILVMIFFAVFLIVGIWAIVLPRQVFNQQCQTNQFQFIQNTKRAYQIAQQTYCRKQACGLKNQTIDSSNYYNEQQKALIRSKYYNRSDNSPTSFINTKTGLQLANQDIQMSAIFTFMQNVQHGIQCSGWCGDNAFLIYYFYDANRGKPLYPCYNKMKEISQQIGIVISIGAFIASSILLLICICGLGVCCYGKNKNTPYANRFLINQYGNNGLYYKVDN